MDTVATAGLPCLHDIVFCLKGTSHNNGVAAWVRVTFWGGMDLPTQWMKTEKKVFGSEVRGTNVTIKKWNNMQGT